MKVPLNPMQQMAKFFCNGCLPQFDEMFFRQMLPKLNEQMISQVASMARNFGMSDEQIQEGMEYLRKFKK